MKSKLKKALVVLMVVSFIVSALAGCGGKTDTNTQNGKEATSNKTAGPVELSIWMAGRTEVEVSPELEVFKKLQEKTNTKFNLTVVPLQNVNEIFNVYMASGEYCDITLKTIRELMKYAPNKVFTPIDEHLKDAPNLKAAFDRYSKSLPEIQGEDKKIYVIPGTLIETELTGFLMRQDWLDKVGLNAPETIDEWYAVLKAFREKDPNGNGKVDEIPIVNRAAGTDRGVGWVKIGRANYIPFLSAWGMDEAFFVENDKVKFGATDPRFLDYLKFLKKLYSEKLMDQEYITGDKKLWEEKLTNGLVGACNDYFNGITTWNTTMKEKFPSIKWVGVNPPVMKKGDKPMTYKARRIFNDASAAAISAKSKRINEAVKLLDYLYSKEGSILSNYGFEGQHFTWEGDKVKYTDTIAKNPNGKSLDVMRFVLGMRLWPSDMTVNEVYRYDPEEIKAREAHRKYLNPAPYIAFTESEKELISTKMNEINTYMDEKIDKMIMGIEPIENYDKFVKTLNAMGVEELQKVYQKAYDKQK